MQNDGRDCKYCQVHPVDIEQLPSYPVYLFFDLSNIKYRIDDEFVCDNCVVKLYRRYLESIRENKRIMEAEEDRIRPYVERIKRLSKKTIFELMNNYINYIINDRNDVDYDIFAGLDYTKMKKSEMIYQIKQHDILEDLCNYIDTLEQP